MKFHVVSPSDFIPTNEDPRFLWLAIRLLGRKHVERIAAKVFSEGAVFCAPVPAKPPIP